MGELESENKWIKLAFFLTVIGFLLLLFTSFGWGGGGGMATAIIGFLFYVAAIIMISAYIFVDEAKLQPVLIAFIVVAIIGGILVLVQIFAVQAYYNSTKGFLSGLSGIAAGIMGILSIVLSG